jgi:cell division cycle 2-like protein
MAGSRWATTAEDDALIKKEKEDKKRRKAEKAQKIEAEKAAAAAAAAAQTQEEERPSKRRKTTPEPDDDAPPKLLRFETEGWSKSRSVENYDKLNDIEEGTYGWVARATEIKTGKVVALKRLKFDAADRGGLPVTGLREIQILKDLRHKNVVGMSEVVVGDDVDRLDK